MPEQNTKKIDRLVVDWKKIQHPRFVDEDEPKVKIHQTIGYLNWTYEYVRKFIDNHQVKQHCYLTILRILNRLLFLERRNPEKVPEMLIEELIRAGFLKNNKVPKKDIKAVWKILDRYIILMDKVSVKLGQITINKQISDWERRSMKREANKWIIVLAAREIERFLVPKYKEEALSKSMYEYMVEQLDIEDSSMTAQEKKVQVYLAVQRAFIKPGDEILSYYLFKLAYPNWASCSEEELEQIAKEIFKIKENIYQQLNHSIKDRLKRLCSRHVVYFFVLREMLDTMGSDDFAALLKDQKGLEKKISEAVSVSYNFVRTKVRIEMIKSTLYVLITKYFIIEIPVKQGLLEPSSLEYLIILLIGPVIMLAVGLSIGKPNKKNTAKIVEVFKRMVFQDKIRNVPYSVKKVIKRSFVKRALFVLVYLALFIFIIFLVYYGFGLYEFDTLITSIVLFFVSMISYFGFRLREIVREYVVLDKKDNVFVFLFDFLSLPILKLGQWLTNFLKKVNFSVPFFDYVLEVPFKAFIRFFEGWTFFVEEKKEELDRVGR